MKGEQKKKKKRGQTPQEIAEAFLRKREQLNHKFGAPDRATSAKAVHEYALTQHPQCLRIHLGVLPPEDPSIMTRGFVVNHLAHDKQWANHEPYGHLFPILRYVPGQYKIPGKPTVFRAWKKGPHWGAILFESEVKFGERFDSASVYLIVKEHGRWQLTRAYKLGCPPDSFAFRMGTQAFTLDDLPNRHILPEDAAHKMISIQHELIRPGRIDSLQLVMTSRGRLSDVRRLVINCAQDMGHMQLAAEIDCLLTGLRP